jgi:single-strand DNA-binding protein
MLALTGKERDMASLNKVMLIGNLGQDPEMKETGSGLTIASFGIATTEKTKNKGHTEWHNIKAFGKLAEICGEYLRKGKQVYVEGRIQTSRWEDHDGTKRQKTEIIASVMQMLGNKQGDGGSGSGSGNHENKDSRKQDDDGPGPGREPGDDPGPEDDIPF